MNNKVLRTVVEIAGNVSPTLQKAVSETCEKLDKVNLKAAAIAGAAAAGAVAVGKAAIEAGRYLADLGGRFDEAADAIRIGTGATGEALDALMEDFDAVYSSVPITMEDAGKAIADYNTRLGLTGEQLQDISRQAIQVADMLGEDLGGVIESSSKAFQQWSIDAADMGDAMDYVFKASQSTGVGFSELMGTVQSFGPQLREMGYSFEEATALIGQLEKAGVNTEEVLGAMKKSAAALAKAGIGAAEGLDMYAEAILNAKDMTQATAIATEVFGTRAASTMAAAIRDGSISVDQLTESLLESRETISGCATDTYDFAEQLQLFKQKAQVALEPLAATVFNSLNELMPVAGELMESLIPVIQDLTKPLTPLIKDAVAKLRPVLTKLTPPLVEITGAVLPVLIRLAEKLMPVIERIAEEVLPVVIQLLDVLAPVLDLVACLLEPILDLVIRLAAPILQLVATALAPLIRILSALIRAGLEPLMPLLKIVAGLFTDSLGSAIAGIQPILSALAGVFDSLISYIQNVFAGNWKGAWDSIVSYFRSVWDTIKAIFKAPVNFMIDGINRFIGGLNKLKIPDWVPGIGGKGLNIPLIPKLAAGGFTDGLSIAGEAGMEAVISFDPAYRRENLSYWQQAGRLLGVLDHTGMDAGARAATAAALQMAEAESGAKEMPQIPQAGRLMELDGFSLGQLTETTVIYYDFSGFSYAPQVEAGDGADKEDIVAALKEQASEFFDWLEEWLRQKEVGNYDRVSIY